MVLLDNQIVFFLPSGLHLAGGGASDVLVNTQNIMNNLYPDLEEEKAVEGVNAECRCIFVKNLSEIDTAVKLTPWVSQQPNAQSHVEFGIGAAGVNGHELQLPHPFMVPPNVQFYDFVDKPQSPMIVKLGPKQVLAFWFNWKTIPHAQSETNVRFTFSLEVEREPEPDPGAPINCPSGQVLDPSTGDCVVPLNCPSGTQYNPITRVCEDDDIENPPGGGGGCGQCAVNFHCDPVTDECVPDVVNPPPTGIIPNRSFAAVGDFDCSDLSEQTWGNIISGLVTTLPDPQNRPLGMLLALGDFSYNDGDQSCWIDAAVTMNNLFPNWIKCTIGNHDDEEDGEAVDRDIILNTFGHPSEGYYAFTWENIRFICMDTQRPLGVGSPQYNFVSQQLAAAHTDPTIKWKVVYYHKPSVTSTGNDHGALVSVANAYHEMFTLFQVDFVLSGHNHNSEVTYQLKFEDGNTDPQDSIIGSQGSQVGDFTVYQGWNGTIYMVLGGGGRAEDTTDADDAFMAAVLQEIAVGFFYLRDNGRTIRFALISSNDFVEHYLLEVRK